jgi:hypothetical protein
MTAIQTKAVNKGWGAKGAATFDISLYKGGGNCHHRWNKQVYAVLEGQDLTLPGICDKLHKQKQKNTDIKLLNPKLSFNPSS